MGLECGSKAELVATLAHLESDDTLLVCNGVKDAGMLRLILAAQSLGKNVIPVVEKYAEFEELLRLGDELAVKPRFGARVRLATSGAGRWQDSGGHRSKFGISTPELVALTGVLRERGMEEGFQLLHFHMGSQISDIQVLKRAVKELTQVYVQLVERGFPLRYVDVGGGLGVNYDTGYGPEDPGINYSLREYANAIVYVVREVCDAGRAPHPVLVSESGRALTAHHSLLVVEVVGTYRKDSLPPEWQPSDTEQIDLKALAAIIRQLRGSAAGPPPLSELLEAYHDTVEIRREMDALFTLGFLRLEDKALAERLYWTACQAILEQLKRHEPDPVPAEFVELEEQLIENTLCDFSVFQSMLDHWAIGQGFPIVPLQRLDERPDKRAVLVDLTCDSDGKVGHYVTSNPDKHFIELHSIADDESYLLGIFLMGAYQDIMGDTHNLFGRVAEAHVYADAEEPGNYYIEKVIPATRVGEMLAQVQYFPQDLERRMNELIRRKVEAGVIRPRAGIEMLERYQRCLTETTYYESEPSGTEER
jgi:arginine decarboxylase